MAASMAGQITWTEIPSLDLARSQKFYSEVFGWEFTSAPMVNPETGEAFPEPIVVLFTKGPCHGSLVKVEPHRHLSAAKHPDNADKKKFAVTVTIATLSVDDTLKAVEKAGGKIYKEKMELPEKQGYLGYFLDTEENVLGAWSSA